MYTSFFFTFLFKANAMFTHVLELGTLLCVRGINVRLRECDKYMKIAEREREKKTYTIKVKARNCPKMPKVAKNYKNWAI